MENTMKCLCRGENKTQLLIAVGYTGAFEDIEDSTSASDFERRVTGCRMNFPLAEEVGAEMSAGLGSCSQLLPLFPRGRMLLDFLMEMD